MFLLRKLQAVSDGLQKRIYRHILRKCLADYLARDVDEDTIDVQLSSGIASLKDIELDTERLGAHLKQSGIQLVHGHVDHVSIRASLSSLINPISKNSGILLSINGIHIDLCLLGAYQFNTQRYDQGPSVADSAFSTSTSSPISDFSALLSGFEAVSDWVDSVVENTELQISDVTVNLWPYHSTGDQLPYIRLQTRGKLTLSSVQEIQNNVSSDRATCLESDIYEGKVNQQQDDNDDDSDLSTLSSTTDSHSEVPPTTSLADFQRCITLDGFSIDFIGGCEDEDEDAGQSDATVQYCNSSDTTAAASTIQLLECFPISEQVSCDVDDIASPTTNSSSNSSYVGAAINLQLIVSPQNSKENQNSVDIELDVGQLRSSISWEELNDIVDALNVGQQRARHMSPHDHGNSRFSRSASQSPKLSEQDRSILSQVASVVPKTHQHRNSVLVALQDATRAYWRGQDVSDDDESPLHSSRSKVSILPPVVKKPSKQPKSVRFTEDKDVWQSATWIETDLDNEQFIDLEANNQSLSCASQQSTHGDIFYDAASYLENSGSLWHSAIASTSDLAGARVHASLERSRNYFQSLQRIYVSQSGPNAHKSYDRDACSSKLETHATRPHLRELANSTRQIGIVAAAQTNFFDTNLKPVNLSQMLSAGRFNVAFGIRLVEVHIRSKRIPNQYPLAIRVSDITTVLSHHTTDRRVNMTVAYADIKTKEHSLCRFGVERNISTSTVKQEAIRSDRLLSSQWKDGDPVLVVSYSAPQTIASEDTTRIVDPTLSIVWAPVEFTLPMGPLKFWLDALPQAPDISNTQNHAHEQVHTRYATTTQPLIIKAKLPKLSVRFALYLSDLESKTGFLTRGLYLDLFDIKIWNSFCSRERFSDLNPVLYGLTIYWDTASISMHQYVNNGPGTIFDLLSMSKAETSPWRIPSETGFSPHIIWQQQPHVWNKDNVLQRSYTLAQLEDNENLHPPSALLVALGSVRCQFDASAMIPMYKFLNDVSSEIQTWLPSDPTNQEPSQVGILATTDEACLVLFDDDHSQDMAMIALTGIQIFSISHGMTTHQSLDIYRASVTCSGLNSSGKSQCILHSLPGLPKFSSSKTGLSFMNSSTHQPMLDWTRDYTVWIENQRNDFPMLHLHIRSTCPDSNANDKECDTTAISHMQVILQRIVVRNVDDWTWATNILAKFSPPSEKPSEQTNSQVAQASRTVQIDMRLKDTVILVDLPDRQMAANNTNCYTASSYNLCELALWTGTVHFTTELSTTPALLSEKHTTCVPDKGVEIYPNVKAMAINISDTCLYFKPIAPGFDAYHATALEFTHMHVLETFIHASTLHKSHTFILSNVLNRNYRTNLLEDVHESRLSTSSQWSSSLPVTLSSFADSSGHITSLRSEKCVLQDNSTLSGHDTHMVEPCLCCLYCAFEQEQYIRVGTLDWCTIGITLMDSMVENLLNYPLELAQILNRLDALLPSFQLNITGGMLDLQCSADTIGVFASVLQRITEDSVAETKSADADASFSSAEVSQPFIAVDAQLNNREEKRTTSEGFTMEVREDFFDEASQSLEYSNIRRTVSVGEEVSTGSVIHFTNTRDLQTFPSDRSTDCTNTESHCTKDETTSQSQFDSSLTQSTNQDPRVNVLWDRDALKDALSNLSEEQEGHFLSPIHRSSVTQHKEISQKDTIDSFACNADALANAYCFALSLKDEISKVQLKLPTWHSREIQARSEHKPSHINIIGTAARSTSCAQERVTKFLKTNESSLGNVESMYAAVPLIPPPALTSQFSEVPRSVLSMVPSMNAIIGTPYANNHTLVRKWSDWPESSSHTFPVETKCIRNLHRPTSSFSRILPSSTAYDEGVFYKAPIVLQSDGNEQLFNADIGSLRPSSTEALDPASVVCAGPSMEINLNLSCIRLRIFACPECSSLPVPSQKHHSSDSISVPSENEPSIECSASVLNAAVIQDYYRTDSEDSDPSKLRTLSKTESYARRTSNISLSSSNSMHINVAWRAKSAYIETKCESIRTRSTFYRAPLEQRSDTCETTKPLTLSFARDYLQGIWLDQSHRMNCDNVEVGFALGRVDSKYHSVSRTEPPHSHEVYTPVLSITDHSSTKDESSCLPLHLIVEKYHTFVRSCTHTSSEDVLSLFPQIAVSFKLQQVRANLRGAFIELLEVIGCSISASLHSSKDEDYAAPQPFEMLKFSRILSLLTSNVSSWVPFQSDRRPPVIIRHANDFAESSSLKLGNNTGRNHTSEFEQIYDTLGIQLQEPLIRAFAFSGSSLRVFYHSSSRLLGSDSASQPLIRILNAFQVRNMVVGLHKFTLRPLPDLFGCYDEEIGCAFISNVAHDAEGYNDSKVSLGYSGGWEAVASRMTEIWVNQILQKQLRTMASAVNAPLLPLHTMSKLGEHAVNVVLVPWKSLRQGQTITDTGRTFVTNSSLFARALLIEALRNASWAGNTASKAIGRIEQTVHATRRLNSESDSSYPSTQQNSISRSLKRALRRAGVVPDQDVIEYVSQSARSTRQGQQPASRWASDAYSSLTRGIADTATTIFAVPLAEYDRQGVGQAAAATLRAVPLAIVKPTAATLDAINSTIGGIRTLLGDDFK